MPIHHRACWTPIKCGLVQLKVSQIKFCEVISNQVDSIFASFDLIPVEWSQVKTKSSWTKSNQLTAHALPLPTCVNTRPGWPTIWQVCRMDCRPLAAADRWWAGMTVMVCGTVCTVPLNCFLLASSTSSGVQLTPCFSRWAENHT